MPKREQYERLSRAAREMIEAAKDISPAADNGEIEVMAGTAVMFELNTAKAD